MDLIQAVGDLLWLGRQVQEIAILTPKVIYFPVSLTPKVAELWTCFDRFDFVCLQYCMQQFLTWLWRLLTTNNLFSCQKTSVVVYKTDPVKQAKLFSCVHLEQGRAWCILFCFGEVYKIATPELAESQQRRICHRLFSLGVKILHLCYKGLKFKILGYLHRVCSLRFGLDLERAATFQVLDAFKVLCKRCYIFS